MNFRIKNINNTPIDSIPYKRVKPSRFQKLGEDVMEDAKWPVLQGHVEGLPESLDAIIVSSDLQGHINVQGELKLLGEGLPSELALILEIEYPEIKLDRVGIILCGDLFAMTHRRGGIGDVRNVWFEFRKYFKWVAGVPGNHDMIGTGNSKVKEFQFEENIKYLENHNHNISGLNISGVGGTIGSSKKINKWREEDFLKAIKTQTIKKPNLLLLHEGPDFPNDSFIGTASVRELLEKSPSTVVCFGHNHWEEPLRELSNGTQLLNLEARSVILLPVK